MELFITTIVIFVTSLLVLEMIYHAYKIARYPTLSKTRKRLKSLTSEVQETGTMDLVSVKIISSVPLLEKTLRRVPKINRLIHLHEQANTKYPLGVFVLLSFVLGLTGHLGSFLMMENYVTSSIVALFMFGIPFYYLILKRKRRIVKFEKQFPEGLELIARALRAGHAITSGMALAAEEFDDPLGNEFGLVIDEIKFGSSITEALKNFADRMDSLEVKYFVVSLIIQRESGGNLSEIIEKIAYIIRERFKFQRKIRALAGEGKLSAIILIALPFVVVTALRFMNPKYIEVLFIHPVGKLLIGIAGCMIVFGILVMKRMINIKV